MIFIISLLIAAVVSFFLTIRSMKGFEDEANPQAEFSLFLIRNESAVNTQLLSELAQLAKTNHCQLSLERLMKGEQAVLVIFGPSTLPLQFPDLALIELEDYLEDPQNSNTVWQNSPKASVNFSLAWQMGMHQDKELKIYDYFLKGLPLKIDQEFFLQIVFYPIFNKDQLTNSFQVTIRAIVVEQNHHTRIELAKLIEEYFANSVNLYKIEQQLSTKSVFESYKKRTIIPKQVTRFVIPQHQLLNILGLQFITDRN